MHLTLNITLLHVFQMSLEVTKSHLAMLIGIKAEQSVQTLHKNRCWTQSHGQPRLGGIAALPWQGHPRGEKIYGASTVQNDPLTLPFSYSGLLCGLIW